MEEFTGEVAALEQRRAVALEKLRAATDPAEVKRLQEELSQIEAAFAVLGEEDA